MFPIFNHKNKFMTSKFGQTRVVYIVVYILAVSLPPLHACRSEY